MKLKRIGLLILTAFIFSAFTMPLSAQVPPDDVKAVIDEPPAPLVSGDADRNGTVDTIDAMLALRMSMDGEPDCALTGVCIDVDKDMAITASDALIIFRSILLEEQLPQNRKIDFLNSLFEQMGKPYVWGGSGPDSFDCSGLVYYCLNQAGYSISRQTAASYAENEAWERINSISELEVGDLMFFRQADESSISHVGIYIGNNMLIHASYSNGRVLITTITNWYTTNFRWGRRVDL